MTLTVPEAARRTGRNEETIRRWIRSGRLRSQRIGTQHLIDEAELAALVEDTSVELPPEWTTTRDRRAMPYWEQLVRDGRRSH
jgi:excisionase family DNA binding protein